METIHQTFYQKAVLIDSSALYAIVDDGDQYHIRASAYFRDVVEQQLPIYITNASIIETYRLVLHKLGTKRALQFLDIIFENCSFVLERMTVDDEEKAREYVRRFDDHELTLTDAVNFAVMLRVGILTMFGFDHHCYVLGFQKAPA